MARDNFKDEFEKSKQPVERQEEVGQDDLVFEGEDFSDDTSSAEFPKRGVSRRNRSADRRRREESAEENASVKDSKKKRRRSAAAGTGAVAAGAGADNHIEEPAKTGEVKSETFVAGSGQPVVQHEDEREHEPEEKEKKNSWLPILAGLLILIPILFLLFMFLGNRDNKDDQNENAVKTEEVTTEKATTEKSKEEKTTEEKTVEKATTEAPATVEEATTETTTEVPSSEAVTTEAVTTEAVTTEAVTTEAPATEAPAATGGGTTHTVGANENLYRIAIRYYGSGTPANVDKIRKANGISGNNLTIGQELVIPK
ncbi:LysM peptidoglycan-binding domain-containing protein [Macrococcus bovicus]|uniref:LysM peptidoglycan-binding domain-containing protein n=1 Tax=Macrococcus bovicus TaxID=69968 RepID=A0A4R6C2I6_9STAP|nr:LysM peptidoglycan-binding domain-containing protein [Macrococcus bovicus]TDM15478.1 LysM peptidoglycan-binding domain-containing protein [Macrococcus bovicus]